MSKLRICINLFFQMLFKQLNIKENRFYFNSFHGQYSDSPKRISEELYKYYPNAEFYWAITEKCHEILPKYIKPVNPNTIYAIYIRYTSKLLVDNFYGAFSGFTIANSLKYKLLTNSLRMGQLIIGTWHGTALKKIATDEPGKKGKNLLFYTNTSYLTCESDHMNKILKRITCEKIPIVMTGYPRNDILFDLNEEKKNALRLKLKLPKEKKIILYAPTFRDGDVEMSGLYQMLHLNMNKLLIKCSEKFGGEWIFVFRVHNSVVEKIKDHPRNSELIYTGNLGDDMSEYLAVADVLLTDYSSSMFDYMLTKKPCFLYCPDLDHYMNVERGFYFNLSDLPFPVADSSDALYRNIDIFLDEVYTRKIETFLKTIGQVDDGHATDKIVKIIRKELEL